MRDAAIRGREMRPLDERRREKVRALEQRLDVLMKEQEDMESSLTS